MRHDSQFAERKIRVAEIDKTWVEGVARLASIQLKNYQSLHRRCRLKDYRSSYLFKPP